MKITENTLDMLRSDLSEHISEKRLSHSLAVEQEIFQLCKLFELSDTTTMKLRAAAILHDITKQKNTEEQIVLCKEFNLRISNDDVRSPKVFHSLTGAYTAKKLYPEFIDRTIFNAIKYHTTGKENMSIEEKLLYLADYIEPTRDFPDCIKLREYFYSASEFNSKHLFCTLLLSFDMTLANLTEEKCYIHPATIKARNGILYELSEI